MNLGWDTDSAVNFTYFRLIRMNFHHKGWDTESTMNFMDFRLIRINFLHKGWDTDSTINFMDFRLMWMNFPSPEVLSMQTISLYQYSSHVNTASIDINIGANPVYIKLHPPLQNQATTNII